jgi:hypothetical protein
VLKRLSVQKLFLITIVLKIAASLAGWRVGSPWILGFSVPLGLMALYILLGLNRGDDSVSDEKFADSCYYLGFIFTISSILVTLLDIPQIQARIGDIAVRFGAAMVSTVFGLVVRVYLVNFRPDYQDSLRGMEAGLLDSARAFRTHLDIAVDRLREFQGQVDDAAKLAVTRVDLALKETAEHHGREFSELARAWQAEHRRLAEESATHLKATGQTLANALQDYAQTLASTTGGFERRLGDFAFGLEARLEHVVFPDDYFTARLEPAVANLGHSVARLDRQMADLALELENQGRSLTATLAALNDRIAVPEPAAESLAVLEQLAVVLERMERSQAEALISLRALEAVVARMERRIGGAGERESPGRRHARPWSESAGLEP